MQQKSYRTYESDETAKLAADFASTLHAGDVVLLKGDLGTGKSTFARALIRALCGQDTEVPSPTFTLVQTYEAPAFTLWHFDLYRLQPIDPLHELGIEEALTTGVSLIEWPEHGGNIFPKESYVVEFEHGTTENERLLTFRRGLPGMFKI